MPATPAADPADLHVRMPLLFFIQLQELPCLPP